MPVMGGKFLLSPGKSLYFLPGGKLIVKEDFARWKNGGRVATCDLDVVCKYRTARTKDPGGRGMEGEAEDNDECVSPLGWTP